MNSPVSSAIEDTLWQLDIGEPVLGIGHLGDRIVVGGTEGAVLVAGNDGDTTMRFAMQDFMLAIAASPDGTRLAVGGSSRLMLFDLADGSPVVDHPHRWCGCLTWSANSRVLAAGDGRQVRVYTRDGLPRWESPALPSTVAGLAWVRGDGRRLAAAAYQGVTIFEPGADRVVDHFAAPGAIAGIALSPNGRWVVGGSQDATLHGWNMRDGSDFAMSGFPRTVSRLAFESSGRWMCCDGGDAVVCWDFSGSGPTGREAVLAEGHRAEVTALAWGPSRGAGSVLASGDAAGDIALWRLGPQLRPGQRIRPSWTVATDEPVCAVVTTGDRVVSGHRSGTVQCFSTG